MLLPGRNTVRLAKELASLDVLSAGRLLCTFVPGLPRRHESGAMGVDGPSRAVLMDEMLPVLRRLWAGETVTHHGRAADFEEVSISPLPVQQPLEFWTGGWSRPLSSDAAGSPTGGFRRPALPRRWARPG